MLQRIKNEDWEFEFDVTQKKFRDTKNKILYYIEKSTGFRLFEYKNYKLI